MHDPAVPTVDVSPLGRTLTRQQFAALRANLAEYNRQLPAELVNVPRDQWSASLVGLTSTMRGESGTEVVAMFRSRSHIAVVYCEAPGRLRLSVCRARLNDDGQFEDGLTWDELQEVKRQAGFGDMWAVEVYPAAARVVNVANQRHLWLLPGPPPVAWP